MRLIASVTAFLVLCGELVRTGCLQIAAHRRLCRTVGKSQLQRGKELDPQLICSIGIGVCQAAVLPLLRERRRRTTNRHVVWF